MEGLVVTCRRELAAKEGGLCRGALVCVAGGVAVCGFPAKSRDGGAGPGRRRQSPPLASSGLRRCHAAFAFAFAGDAWALRYFRRVSGQAHAAGPGPLAVGTPSHRATQDGHAPSCGRSCLQQR